MTFPEDSAASGPTSTGLPPNVAGALSYLLGALTGVLFFVLERDNKFVRFHAAQSIAVSVVLIVLGFVLGMLSTVLAFIPLIGWLVVMVASVGLSLLSFVLWLYLMWQAYQGKEWEAPFAGPFARKML